jgi:hypothetical protein
MRALQVGDLVRFRQVALGDRMHPYRVTWIDPDGRVTIEDPAKPGHGWQVRDAASLELAD